LSSEGFVNKYLNFRLYFPDGNVRVPELDEDVDIRIKGTRCMILSPSSKHKKGVLEDIEI